MVRELTYWMKYFQWLWIMFHSRAQGNYMFPEEQTFIIRLEQRVIVQAIMWEKLKQAVGVIPMTAGLLPSRLLNPASILCRESLYPVWCCLWLPEKEEGLCFRAQGLICTFYIFLSMSEGRREPLKAEPMENLPQENLSCLSASLGGAGSWEWKMGFCHHLSKA